MRLGSYEGCGRLRWPLATAGARIFADPWQSDSPKGIWRWQPLLCEVYATPGAESSCEAIESYIVEATDLPIDRLRDEMSRVVDPRVGERIMSTAEKLRREGRLEGRVEGRVEGLAEGRLAGKRDALLRMLRQRFGEPTAGQNDRILAASSEHLDGWADRLLSARSLRDLLGD